MRVLRKHIRDFVLKYHYVGKITSVYLKIRGARNLIIAFFSIPKKKINAVHQQRNNSSNIQITLKYTLSFFKQNAVILAIDSCRHLCLGNYAPSVESKAVVGPEADTLADADAFANADPEVFVSIYKSCIIITFTL